MKTDPPRGVDPGESGSSSEKSSAMCVPTIAKRAMRARLSGSPFAAEKSQRDQDSINICAKPLDSLLAVAFTENKCSLSLSQLLWPAATQQSCFSCKNRAACDASQ